jgi:DNA-directed RNA polymerase beta' subunit
MYSLALYENIGKIHSLHSGSMIAQKVKILQGKTIRMNLATTKTFNAD